MAKKNESVAPAQKSLESLVHGSKTGAKRPLPKRHVLRLREQTEPLTIERVWGVPVRLNERTGDSVRNSHLSKGGLVRVLVLDDSSPDGRVKVRWFREVGQRKKKD